MRDLERTVRLSATLFFGLAVLALMLLLSTQMAARYFRVSAERAVRQVFREGTQARSGPSYSAVCRGSGFGGDRASECDPIEVTAGRSLRSSTCSHGGFLPLPGGRWMCSARFTDGATLSVRISLGFGRPELELLLPLREPDT